VEPNVAKTAVKTSNCQVIARPRENAANEENLGKEVEKPFMQTLNDQQ
jgi:hypothetical protein